MAVLNFDIKSVNLPSGEEAKAVFLSGSIDASTNQTFEGRLGDILSSGTNKVLLVLTNVKYINSTGLGTIVKCVDNFREKDGDIKLVGVPTKVIALFEMLGLLALFETHDTIEQAVASFGAESAPSTGGAGDSGDSSAPTVEFPLQFKHPSTGMGLNVNRPGRFKDPRSGDYFSVDAKGTIEFYEMHKVKIVEVKFPCDTIYSPGLMAMAKALAESMGLSQESIAAAERSVDEACSIIGKNQVQSGDTCNVLLVADKEKLQIGFVSSSDALNLAENDPCLVALQQSMDSVKHQVLPNKGYLLTMAKKS